MVGRYTPYDEVVELIDDSLIDEGLGKVTISHSLHTTESESSDGSPKLRRPVHGAIKSQQSKQSARAQAAKENPKQRKSVLSWRSDPSASFSDWTIEVATVEDDRIVCSTFFHCHSNVLVWGPRKCDVFVKLFQERMQLVPPTTITQIELPVSEAEVFPILLDFVYCETTLSLSANQICSIYLLAERFENEMLVTAIHNFVENLLDFEQSIEFLSYARSHDMREKIERLVLSMISKICGYLVQYPAEAKNVPPELLAHILHRRAQVMKVLKGEDPRKFSGEWEVHRSKLMSLVVAECCHHAATSKSGEHQLTRRTFERLINSKHLPALDSEAALKMLQVDAILDAKKETGDVTQRNQLSSFESRCVKALVTDWREILTENQGSIFSGVLSSIRSHILADILLQVSRQYERTIAGNGTSRRHDILESVSQSEFNRMPCDDTQTKSIHNLHETLQHNHSSPPDCTDALTKIFSKENCDDSSQDDGRISPANRYSVANVRYP